MASLRYKLRRPTSNAGSPLMSSFPNEITFNIKSGQRNVFERQSHRSHRAERFCNLRIQLYSLLQRREVYFEVSFFPSHENRSFSSNVIYEIPAASPWCMRYFVRSYPVQFGANQLTRGQFVPRTTIVSLLDMAKYPFHVSRSINLTGHGTYYPHCLVLYVPPLHESIIHTDNSV